MRDDTDSEQRAIHEEIRLVAYDATWPTQFMVERERLLAQFPQLLEVEHFGSTAICGMPAKPIIDLLGGVESMAIADALFEPILGYGYTTSRAFNAMLPNRRWFMRSANGRRTHHLHLVGYRTESWNVYLRFRDALRSDAALAHRYSSLKLELAERFSRDREAYTDAKSAFITSVVAVA